MFRCTGCRPCTCQSDCSTSGEAALIPELSQNLLLPNPDLPRRMREEIRAKLHVSLHHLVFEVLGQRITPAISEGALHAMVLKGNGFPNAAVFALHASLLNAAQSDDLSDVPELFRILGRMTTRQTGVLADFSITPMGEPHLHPDDIAVLQRAFADDVGLTTTLASPPAGEAERAGRLITESLAALDRAAPVWGEELRLYADQVYLAVARDSDAYLFGGAAVFDAFGGVLLNPLGLRTHAATLMALVHESSHQQMFLFHLNDPVVLNDADAAYVSPLRAEPRPMEGIFHAMWVSARMVLAADTVMASANRPEWAEDLAEHRSRALAALRDCASTVAAHAELTELGAALFASARETIDGF